MVWTVQKAVDRVRVLLADQVVPFRNPDSEIIDGLNMALVESRKLRPDLYLPKVYLYEAPSLTEADLASDLPIDAMYFTPVVEYVAGWVSLEDDEFAVDGRAITLLNRFSQKMVGKGA